MIHMLSQAGCYTIQNEDGLYRKGVHRLYPALPHDLPLIIVRESEVISVCSVLDGNIQ